MKKLVMICFMGVMICVGWGMAGNVFGGVVYQDFETGNGTPPKPADQGQGVPEYGWGLGGAIVGRAEKDYPVHSEERSFKMTIPEKTAPMTAGMGIPSQAQTYNVNFIPECHDRLSFWVWSDPSKEGDHTVLVKIFDQGKYKLSGVEVWTPDQAKYRQWSQLSVLFNQLPDDFDFNRIDKIVFLHYWPGTYYYDDIQVRSSYPVERDLECLQKEYYIACEQRQGPETIGELDSHSSSHSYPSTFPAIMGLQDFEESCVILDHVQVNMALDYKKVKGQQFHSGLKILQQKSD